MKLARVVKPGFRRRAAFSRVDDKRARSSSSREPSRQACAFWRGEQERGRKQGASPQARTGRGKPRWRSLRQTSGTRENNTVHAAMTICVLLQRVACGRLERAVTKVPSPGLAAIERIKRRQPTQVAAMAPRLLRPPSRVPSGVIAGEPEAGAAAAVVRLGRRKHRNWRAVARREATSVLFSPSSSAWSSCAELSGRR